MNARRRPINGEPGTPGVPEPPAPPAALKAEDPLRYARMVQARYRWRHGMLPRGPRQALDYSKPPSELFKTDRKEWHRRYQRWWRRNRREDLDPQGKDWCK